MGLFDSAAEISYAAAVSGLWRLVAEQQLHVVRHFLRPSVGSRSQFRSREVQ
jgi:hypothetical protein